MWVCKSTIGFWTSNIYRGKKRIQWKTDSWFPPVIRHTYRTPPERLQQAHGSTECRGICHWKDPCSVQVKLCHMIGHTIYTLLSSQVYHMEYFESKQRHGTHRSAQNLETPTQGKSTTLCLRKSCRFFLRFVFLEPGPTQVGQPHCQ